MCGIPQSLTPSTTSAPKCFQCGSPLIEISKVTSQPEGSLFPQTVYKFRCSNKECQDQKDKEEAKRIKLRDERVAAEKERKERRIADQQKRTNDRLERALGSKDASKSQN